MDKLGQIAVDDVAPRPRRRNRPCVEADDLKTRAETHDRITEIALSARFGHYGQHSSIGMFRRDKKQIDSSKSIRAAGAVM